MPELDLWRCLAEPFTVPPHLSSIPHLVLLSWHTSSFFHLQLRLLLMPLSRFFQRPTSSSFSLLARLHLNLTATAPFFSPHLLPTLGQHTISSKHARQISQLHRSRHRRNEHSHSQLISPSAHIRGPLPAQRSRIARPMRNISDGTTQHHSTRHGRLMAVPGDGRHGQPHSEKHSGCLEARCRVHETGRVAADGDAAWQKAGCGARGRDQAVVDAEEVKEGLDLAEEDAWDGRHYVGHCDDGKERDCEEEVWISQVYRLVAIA